MFVFFFSFLFIRLRLYVGCMRSAVCVVYMVFDVHICKCTTKKLSLYFSEADLYFCYINRALCNLLGRYFYKQPETLGSIGGQFVKSSIVGSSTCSKICTA